MIKKLFFVLLATGALAITSCNDSKDKTKDKDKEETSTNDDADKKDEEDDDITKAAKAYCACFNDNINELDSRLKKMIIKASKSDDPKTVLQNEVAKIDDEEEKQKIQEEMKGLSEMDGVVTCSNKIAKKYNHKDNDPKTQKKVINALKGDSDCDLFTALMKIGMNKEAMNDEPADDTEN